MKRKILFAAYSLDVGGIETALITLINKLAEQNYDITLYLEKKQGIFIDKINKKITIKEYTPSNNKLKLLAKCKNATKRFLFYSKNKNKFECSISFATYSKPGSFIARTASNNNVLWVHNDYLGFFQHDEKKYKKFFKDIEADKFKKIVFVSNDSMIEFKKRFKNINSELIVCNNLINYDSIIEKSKEEVALKKVNECTFLNIGRHDEKQKRLTRLINVCKRLKNENYKFSILMVGSGEDTETYKNLVSKYELNDCIKFLGKQKNPYPYYKISDCVVLTSDYEGYPVVYVESLVLGKTLITTDVSDSKIDIQGKYGFVCEKNEEDIYKKMKEFIVKGYEKKHRFNPVQYNDEVLAKVKYIIGEDENEVS